MKLKSVKIILALFVLIQSFLFNVSLPELVLCFGEDGHVAIEKASNNSCDHDDEHLTKLENEEKINERHEDCTDLNLDWHFSNADIKLKNYIPHNNSSKYSVNPLLKFSDNTFRHLNKSQFNPNLNNLNSIRTTVFLI